MLTIANIGGVSIVYPDKFVHGYNRLILLDGAGEVV